MNWYKKAQTGWDGFPLREDIGESPSEKDIAPERTAEGDFVLYHGTDINSAKRIIETKTLLPDDIGSVGITTTPGAADTYAYHKIYKGKPVILKVIISKEWLKSQELRHEIGGPGASAFLIQPNYKMKGKAIVPPEAIKSIEILGKR